MEVRCDNCGTKGNIEIRNKLTYLGRRVKTPILCYTCNDTIHWHDRLELTPGDWRNYPWGKKHNIYSEQDLKNWKEKK